MSDYLPSFIVEPVLRQARRLSTRLGSTDDSPSYLPTVPESLRTWYPTRFWNTSPPLPSGEEEYQESTLQQLTRNIQLWTHQMPSPPLEPMDDERPGTEAVNGRSDPIEPVGTEFPALDPEVAPQPSLERLEPVRSGSETSLNPLREVTARSRALQVASRGHSLSDPVAAISRTSSLRNLLRDNVNALTPTTDDGYHRTRDGSGVLPEDDGMGQLRNKISAIWNGEGTAAEKSQHVHDLMMERYRRAKALGKAKVRSSSPRKYIAVPDRSGTPLSTVSGASQDVLDGANQQAVFNLTPADLVLTYAPVDKDECGIDLLDDQGKSLAPELGCVHYKRKVKMQCRDCERWYPCRLCHDETEDHVLPRRETKNMLCMLCNTPQPASQTCRMCGSDAAYYYCAVCKLWNDDPQKSIYHCNDCGICRLGQGLGKDFFHCETCAACMSIQVEFTHKCIERSTKCDCPICGEYMFTSNNSVVFMRCGHSIHEKCFKDWCNTSYKCPICSKSIANMESQFRRLDRHIADQPMPEEYRETKALVFCNDCSRRGTTKYHWLGLKCDQCESYNTTQLNLIGPSEAPPPSIQRENGGVTAITPNDISDEAVPIPNSTVASRRPSLTQAHSPGTSEASSWLQPQSPSAARSVSPVVGNYFGTSSVRRGTPMTDDEELSFWGTRSPRENEDAVASADEESSDEDEVMDDHCVDDEDEDEDMLDLPGHR